MRKTVFLCSCSLALEYSHPTIPKITSGSMLISVTAQSPAPISFKLAPNRKTLSSIIKKRSWLRWGSWINSISGYWVLCFFVKERLLCRKIALILKQDKLVCMHVVIDGVDAEATVFVCTIVQKQAPHIAVL